MSNSNRQGVSINNSSAGGSNINQVHNGRTVQSGDSGNDKNANQHERRRVHNVDIDFNKQSSVRDDSVECDKMYANCHRC